MSITEVTRQSRHSWAVWIFVLGFFAVIVGTMLVAYAPGRSGVVVVLATIATATVYGLVGWALIRSFLRPYIQWDIYLANDAKNWIRVTASQSNGLCNVSLNGDRVVERQSLKLMFDMDVTLTVPIADHAVELLIRTPWFLRMKMYLDVDGERVVAA